MPGDTYEQFWLKYADCAVCEECEMNIPFDTGSIGDLLDKIEAHKCDLPKGG